MPPVTPDQHLAHWRDLIAIEGLGTWQACQACVRSSPRRAAWQSRLPRGKKTTIGEKTHLNTK